MSLIETVPNISEGRRSWLIEQLADDVHHVGDARLLDYSSDAAHNRSVFTIVGSANALERAVLALVARAVHAIDLRQHQGEHPRLGAMDVVPFIPLEGTTMADCVGLARRVGRAIGEGFGIPVYLYEDAAAHPHRTHLEDIRRGQFEGLAEKMSHPEWTPDFGPSQPHPSAGATVVGARRALIAYNVNLATDRLTVARRIAAAVRQSGGGLPCVKALGVSLAHRGIVQVSMNLTDYERTPIQVVFDRVVAEAARDGVEVLDSEIIGLIPRAALADTTPAHLRLRTFSDSQILEHRLATG